MLHACNSSKITVPKFHKMFPEISKFINFITIFGSAMRNAFKQVQTCLVFVILSRRQIRNCHKIEKKINCLIFGNFMTIITNMPSITSVILEICCWLISLIFF